MNAWYAVHTKPQGEFPAATHLRRQGYGVYLPVERVWVRHARKRQLVRRPLFPRYMFVAVDRGAKPWRPIQSTVGVEGLVRCGDEPVPVRAEVIAALQAREQMGDFDQDSTMRHLNPGDAVRIIDGPFDSLIGRLIDAGDLDRVTILFELLGRPVRAEMPAASIEAA